MTDFYRHKYGGIYRYIDDGITYTVDGTELVVYHHIWPYDYKVYARPKLEFFDGRFTPISQEKVIQLVVIEGNETNREKLKQEIEKNRNAARNNK